MVSGYDQAIRDVYDLRVTLEDHRVDCKRRQKKDGRRLKRDKDKIRGQYFNGNVPKALAFEIVALSNHFGQSAGKFLDEEDFFALRNRVTRIGMC